MSPTDEGYLAALSGKKYSDNPHRPGSKEYFGWAIGWSRGCLRE